MLLGIVCLAKQADSLYLTGNYKMALGFYQKNLKNEKGKNDSSKVVQCYIDLAKCEIKLGKYKVAASYLDSAANFDLSRYRLKAQYLLIKGILYFYRQDEVAVKYLDSAKLEFLTSKNINDRMAVYFHIGNFYNYLKNDPRKAEEYYDSATLNLGLEVGKFEVARLYYSRASSSRKIGDYASALNYVNKIESIFEGNSVDKLFNAKVSLLRANIFNSKSNFSEAIEAYKRTIKLYHDFNRDDCTVFLKNYVYPNIAYCFSRLDRYDSAVVYLNKCDETFRKVIDIDSKYDVDILYSKGWVFENQKLLDSALYYYQKGLHSAKDSRGKRLGYFHTANIYFQQGFLDSALYNYQQSLANYVEGFEGTDIFENPNWKDIRNDYISYEVLSAKSKIFKQLYHETDDINYLLESINLKEFVIDILIHNRGDLRFMESKYVLSHHFLLEFEDMIDSYYKLYQTLGDSFYLDKMLGIFDKRGSLIIQELRDSSIVREFNIDIKTVQESIPNTTQLLTYFWGLDHVYSFSITDSDFAVKRVEKSDVIESLIESYNQNISSQSLSLEKYKEFIDLSEQIYALLLNPMVKGKENLVIIPDGPLNQLSFATLLYSKVEEKPTTTNFKTLPYLIKKYKIRYQLSLSDYVSEESALPVKWENTNLVAFGEGEPENVGRALKGSQRELDYLKDNFKGTYYSGKEATKNNFRKSADQASILHLSTHGLGSKTSLDSSKLVFFGTGDNENLFLNELYNMDLRAKLVLLTACETGNGKWLAGEGVFSISRGFMATGVESLIATLWKINDAESAKLIKQFYEGISNEEYFSHALSKAQLSYLSNADELTSHPANWGGFVLIGNDTSFKKDLGITVILLTMTSVILLILTVVLYKKRSH